MLTATQAAYMAGMIDGEGSLEVQKQMQRNGKTPQYNIRLSFTMVTQEPLQTMASWLGIKGPKKYKARQPKHSDPFRLHIPKIVTLAILEDCADYLLTKKQQAKLIIRLEALRQSLSTSRKHTGSAHFVAMPPEWEQQAEPIYREFRRLKTNKRPGNPAGRPRKK